MSRRWNPLKKSPTWSVVIVTATLLLSGCAANNQKHSSGGNSGLDAEQVSMTENRDSSSAGEDQNGMADSAAALAGSHTAEATLYKGNGRMVDLPEVRPPVKLLGDDVTLNFEAAPLIEVVHAVMGDILEQDYIVEHPIKGDVTLRTRTPVPRDQLLVILESLLHSNKALMIRDKQGRYIISASGQLGKLRPGVSSAGNSGAGYSTIVVPLQYIGATNMMEILKPVAEEQAFVRVDEARNLLMLAGTRAQLDGWLEIVYTFDVDLLAGMSVGIFPLENSTVDEIDEALQDLLGGELGGEAEGESGSSAASIIGGLVRIIPVERLNSILVVTAREHYLERLGIWIKRLDQAPDLSFEQSLHVYPVQNSTAGHIAELLSSVYSGSGTGGSRGGGGVAPGLTPETISSGGGAKGGGGKSGSSGSKGSGGGTTNMSVDGVRVVADEENNALLIFATGKEFERMKLALLKLDVVPAQVIIEASIIEVSLTDDLKYGLEWTFKDGLGSDYSAVGQLLNSGSTPASLVPGFSYAVSNSIGDISAVLNALATESLVNVISTPSVMVLDNHTANIHVGDQVPIKSSTTITNGGNSQQSITYRDTGVKLSVTPSINAGSMVTMDIDQSVTDVGEVDSATGQRSFLERNITSRVAVRSGESVVLGGLIRENSTDGSAGVPFLHSIPLLGGLFGTTTITDKRTELLVIITPRVMYNEADLDQVGREMRARMRGLELIDEADSSHLRTDDRASQR